MNEDIPSEITWIAGVDEVGRGPIAGPVTAGVCLCHRSDWQQLKKDFSHITDSKKLSAKQREQYTIELKKESRIRLAIANSNAQTIDCQGITRALRQAVSRALRQLEVNPETTMVLLDGRLYAPKTYPYQKTIIKGDLHEWLIGAASIVAKVHRDTKMIKMAKKYPKYKFANHKGYGTKAHYEAIKKYGLTDIHRCSFLSKVTES